MRAAARMRAYRSARNLTQEALAQEWGVSVRTVARWERGEGRPTEWMRHQMASIVNPLQWPTMSIVTDLIEQRFTPGMIIDENMKVLTATALHKKWFQSFYGVDIVGVDWRQYTSDDALAMFERGGGLSYMIKNGLMCIRGLYRDPGGAEDSDIPPVMFTDLTVLRIPDYGSVCVSISRLPTPEDGTEAVTPYFMD